MSISANLPVQSIADLAAQVAKERAKLDAELATLLSQVQRDPNFSGSAADKYDGYIAQWKSGQDEMMRGLDSAAALLRSFAERLEELNLQVAQGFNV